MPVDTIILYVPNPIYFSYDCTDAYDYVQVCYTIVAWLLMFP